FDNSLHDLHQQTVHFAKDRDEHVNKANRALSDVMAPARISRARLAETQMKVEQVKAGLGSLRKDNEKKRDRLRTLRETLAARRRTLSLAKLQTHASSTATSPPTSSSPSSHSHISSSSPLPPSISAQINDLAGQLNLLSQTIARARSGLVQELVEVFNIVEVGGRPPIGGKAGTKGEWTIGDLILPVPGDMRRYPPDHINAVVTHTIHFLTLLTFYLGIKLPFEIIWTGGKLGLGQPWIGAIRGPEGGGWARWYNKHPLHLSSSATPAQPPPSSNTSSSSRSRTNSAPSIDPISDSILGSFISPSPTNPSFPTSSSSSQGTSSSSSQPTSPTQATSTPLPVNPASPSFTTALSMLLYNTTYLAHTQSIHIPLSQVGDVLSNLWTVCCASELGRWSHETWPWLGEVGGGGGAGGGLGGASGSGGSNNANNPTSNILHNYASGTTPTQPFTLEFGQVVQAMMRGPVTKARGRGSSSSSTSPSGGGHRKSSSTSGGGRGAGGKMGRIDEGMREEEEDGWDLVDDDI
ncbi:hypothetical protein CVT24_006826, partial [Panaeolus cyanescens]